ncbi:hypothetical protein, partial [Bacillus thuringiensis]|uniref:hypothetical protein n=1 Tax=Bacillus thuringiensis TaxID=1428 RepID=UPI003D6D35E2
KIINAIQQIKPTCIVIPHPLQTIQHFHPIILIQNPTILQTPPPAQLLKNKPPYYHIYHRQLQN